MSALVLGHKNPDTDSIVSAIAFAHVLNSRGISAKAVAQGEPSPETKFVLDRFKLSAPEVVKSVSGQELYLVDYSDLAQAPADIADAKVLGIVDHHKLGDLTTDTPLECWIQPYGCANTIVKMVADYYNVKIPADIAGAMLCAILSDTVLFKSPTCTELDKKAVDELAKIAGVSDINALGMEMFKAKSNLDASPRDLIFRDFKDFEMGGKKIGIGQLELISLDMVSANLKDALKKELSAVKSENRHSAVLVLTDIMKEGSELLVVSDEEDKIISAMGTQKSDMMWMPGVMSRKKQVVPPLQAAFK